MGFYDFLNEAAEASLALQNLGKPQLNAKRRNRLNVFYYVPQVLTMAGFDCNDWLQNLVNVFDKLKHNKQASDAELKALAIDNECICINPKTFSMDLTVRMFDEQSNLILEQNMTGFKFNQPAPNESYCMAYTPRGRKRYNGIGFYLPELEAGKKYQLEIIETWYIKRNLLFSNVNGTGTFTHKITLPLTAGDVQNTQIKFDYAKNDINYQNFRMLKGRFDFYNKTDTNILPFNNKMDKYLPNKIKPGQVIVYVADQHDFLLMYDTETGVFPCFCPVYFGNYFKTKSDEVKKVKKLFLKSLGLKAALNNRNIMPIGDKLFDLLLDHNVLHDSVNLNLLAGLLQLHYPIKSKYDRVLDHNKSGVQILTSNYLMLGHKPKYMIFSDLTNERHRSCYDFEDYTLPIIVPKLKKKAQAQ